MNPLSGSVDGPEFDDVYSKEDSTVQHFCIDQREFSEATESCNKNRWLVIIFIVLALSTAIGSGVTAFLLGKEKSRRGNDDDELLVRYSVAASVTLTGVNSSQFGTSEISVFSRSILLLLNVSAAAVSSIESVVVTDIARRILSSDHHQPDKQAAIFPPRHLIDTDQVSVAFVLVTESLESDRNDVVASMDSALLAVFTSPSLIESWNGTHIAPAIVESGTLEVADLYETLSPSHMPTWLGPSTEPSVLPTSQPTSPGPTVAPSPTPTTSSQPSAFPTSIPTATPSNNPSGMPTSSNPSGIPTALPTSIPTATPSSNPSIMPTALPTSIPTATPSSNPSGMPTASPTSIPTGTPSSLPTNVPSHIPTLVPTPIPSMMRVGLHEACEFTEAHGEMQPFCEDDYECIFLHEDPTNTSLCIDCTDPQWSWDCVHWDWQKLSPAKKQCGTTCTAFDTGGRLDYYIDDFNALNTDVWHTDSPCVEYGWSIEDGWLYLKLDNYVDDDGTDSYGSCVYGKQVYGTGNYTMSMTALDDIVDGYITTFYMYSENLTYADHDEIDFEFRSGNDDDTHQNIWTNVFHTTDSYAWGKSIEIEMDKVDEFGSDFSLQEEHSYRIEFVLGEFVKWYVDDVLIRTEIDEVPTHKMSIRLSIWNRNNCNWCGTYDDANSPQYVKYNTALWVFDEETNNCKNNECQCEDFSFNGNC